MAAGGAVVQTGRSGTTAATYTGSAGADTFIMANAADVIDGGAGDSDTLDINFNAILGGIQVDLSSKTDQITTFNGSANAAIQVGFENVDLAGFTGTFGADITAAATGSTITGTANADIIRGGAAADTLNGGAGADVISGGGGNDTIRGGAGNDNLTGGAGADTFVFEATQALNGTDTITDFTIGTGGDIINLVAGLTTAATIKNTVTNGAIINFSAAALALEGTTIAVSNQLIVINSAALAVTGYDTAAEIVTLLDTGAFDAVDFAINQTSYMLIAPDAGSSALLWQVTNDGTAAIAAGELTLVGTINIAAEGIDALLANQFVLVA